MKATAKQLFSSFRIAFLGVLWIARMQHETESLTRPQRVMCSCTKKTWRDVWLNVWTLI